jgi:hypothetical protein
MSDFEKTKPRRFGRKAKLLVVGGVAAAVAAAGVVEAQADEIVVQHGTFATWGLCNYRSVIIIENLSAENFEKIRADCAENIDGTWDLITVVTVP